MRPLFEYLILIVLLGAFLALGFLGGLRIGGEAVLHADARADSLAAEVSLLRDERDDLLWEVETARRALSTTCPAAPAAWDARAEVRP